jgi:hypothetical protein
VEVEAEKGLLRVVSTLVRVQVSAVAALSALVDFCSIQPVFPTPDQSEGLPPTGGDLMVLAEAAQVLSPPPGTASGGAGWVVVEQVRIAHLHG